MSIHRSRPRQSSPPAAPAHLPSRSWAGAAARPGPARLWAGWLVSFLGFPLGGLPAIALGGVDDPVSAAVGGLAAGVVIGGAQGLVLRRLSPGLLTRWAVGTGAGLALGLSAGSAVVNYGTSGSDLVVQGLASGVGVGVAQALVLSRVLGGRPAVVWAAAVSLLWPLGWTVTRLAGISVEDQFAVFGASGALVFSAASGAVLVFLLRPRGGR